MKAKVTIVIKADEDEIRNLMDTLYISTAEELKTALKSIYAQATAGMEENTNITVEVEK